MAQVDGLKLDPAWTHTTEVQSVPVDANRRWTFMPGQAKSFEELGVSKTEAMQLVKEHNLPLVAAKAELKPNPGDSIPDDHVAAEPLPDEVGAPKPEGEDS